MKYIRKKMMDMYVSLTLIITAILQDQIRSDLLSVNKIRIVIDTIWKLCNIIIKYSNNRTYS